MESIYRKIYKELLKAEKVFVFGHPKCGDALGSTLAMTLWLESIGKECVAFSCEDVPENLQFLPSSNRIIKKIDNLDLRDFDTILVLDTDFPHSGIAEKLKKEISQENNCVINIDHHISNQGDGDLNAIDKTASSTSKMIYDFFKVNNVVISRKIATCLITGIFYDTGIFSNAATDYASLSSAADLLEKGVPLRTIISDMVNNKSIALLKVWGKIFERLRKNYDIVFTFILNSDDDKNGSVKTGEIANFLNNLNEGKFSMIVNESEEGLVKVSLRTTRDDVDVAKFAAFFGGGGHKKSAGFALPGSLVYNESDGNVRVI